MASLSSSTSSSETVVTLPVTNRDEVIQRRVDEMCVIPNCIADAIEDQEDIRELRLILERSLSQFS